MQQQNSNNNINTGKLGGTPNFFRYYFLGIGGIGMSALARYYNSIEHFKPEHRKTGTKRFGKQNSK